MTEKNEWPMFKRVEWGTGAQALLIMACIVVVVAGLRLGAAILLPFFVALFLAILSLPIMHALRSRRVPTPLAIVITLGVDLAVIGFIVLLASNSVAEFQDRLPGYAARLSALTETWMDALQDRGLPVTEYISTEIVSPGAIIDFVGGTLGRVATFITTSFVVALIMIFMLAEAAIFPDKFRAIFGQTQGEVSRFAKITGEIQEYLVIKTLVSLATGLCIGVWCWFMGVDFPVLLGLIGFVLNYVPTIGSIIAAIPAVLLSLIQFGGIGTAAVVATGYLGINIVFGNLVEPHLLGRRLGLSTLVVIVSLIFWAWVWGPVGALLAVPLTMVVKIMLEHTQDLRWVAVLLDKEAPQIPVSDDPGQTPAIASAASGAAPAEPVEAQAGSDSPPSESREPRTEAEPQP